MQEVYSYFNFHLPTVQLFFQHGQKLWTHISFSPLITGNILIVIIRLTRYHLWLASNSTFMTDHDWFLYLGAVQIWQNLSEHHYYLTSTKSVIRQMGANCFPFQSRNIFAFYIWLEGLKRIYYSVISIFSKYHLKLAHYSSSYLHMYLLP